MRILLVSVFTILLINMGSSQDTLRVMHYNLLNYGNCFSGCTSSNNNLDEKDEYLRQIVRYVNPTILTVNELCVQGGFQQRILDEVMNDGWISFYRKASIQNQAHSDIVNQLYYDSRKLVFHSHQVVQSYIRDIDLFKLYYYSNDLTQGDTTFIYCIVAHLKAGNDPDDEQKRDIMTENVMSFLNETGAPGNRLFMGDLNVYRASEPGFNNLLAEPDPDTRFHDPVDQTGEWHNNNQYSSVHTQSTRAGELGCGAPGGMDDRFDFILISNSVKEGQFAVQYIEGSYKALGQDGQHFNMSVNDPPENSTVPPYLLDALYRMSDHLPVVMELRVDKTIGLDEKGLANISVTNPVYGFAVIHGLDQRQGDVSYTWTDLAGRTAGSGSFSAAEQVRLSTPEEAGTYILRLFSDDGYLPPLKVLRVN